MAALHQSQLTLPPSLDLALLSTPPSSEALRHSGGDNLLWTSAMVTLYLLVEDSSDSRPGVEQKMSVAWSLGGMGTTSMEECEEKASFLMGKEEVSSYDPLLALCWPPCWLSCRARGG